MYKVLFIDDEPDLVRFTASFLAQAGFETRGVSLASQAIAEIEGFLPDVVLLDKMMPEMSGSDIYRQMRERLDMAHIPVIMVTGVGAEMDKVDAFNMGVHDYITKPFSLPELSARIGAICRRRSTLFGGTMDSMVVDPVEHRTTVDGMEVALTRTEFNLLHELFLNMGKVQTRDRLRQNALHDQNVTDRTIDVHIAAIRRKLMEHGARIKTVRGVGYKLVAAAGTPVV